MGGVLIIVPGPMARDDGTLQQGLVVVLLLLEVVEEFHVQLYLLLVYHLWAAWAVLTLVMHKILDGVLDLSLLLMVVGHLGLVGLGPRSWVIAYVHLGGFYVEFGVEGDENGFLVHRFFRWWDEVHVRCLNRIGRRLLLRVVLRVTFRPIILIDSLQT